MKIGVISYLNSVPFVYGIEKSGLLDAQIKLGTPAEVVDMYQNKEVDIALVSAATIPSLKSTEIITDYCIGATGPVRTVEVVSNTNIGHVRRIWVDSHSRTAVQLAGYLADFRWQIKPEWLLMTDYSVLDNPAEGDAFLIIGDKVFQYENRFKYCYDLAAEWKAQTDLPFAFAVWVSRKGVPYDIHDALEGSLTYGMENLYSAIMESKFADREYAYDYLTRNIDYFLDIDKYSALKKFWDYGLRIDPKVQPG